MLSWNDVLERDLFALEGITAGGSTLEVGGFSIFAKMSVCVRLRIDRFHGLCGELEFGLCSNTSAFLTNY